MELIRKEINMLNEWYQSPLRQKPCVLFGARQVGKSTLAESFAKQTGRQVITINFWKDTQKAYEKIFTQNSHALDIIRKLETHLNARIDPEKSILILDEIQEWPVVYSLFKTFKEDTTLPIIATGSYLKLFLSTHLEIELPIGCTHEYLVTPLTFSDFLKNANKSLFDFYHTASINQIVDDHYHDLLLQHYYQYLFTGGMPEVISTYLTIKDQQGDFAAAQLCREIQKQILSGYKNDFLTFGTKKLVVGRNIAEKLALTFNTIPKELAKYKQQDKPVSRFKFTSLNKKTEYKRVSNIFEYLSLAGLIIKSYVIKNPTIPLINEDENKNSFKCFYFDVGMLQADLNIPYQKIIDDGLSHYKGPIAENFVAQQLFAMTKQDLYSWKDAAGKKEVEFIYQNNELIPIEVKSSKKSRPSKSLEEYIKIYKPKQAIKIAPRNYGTSRQITSLPIYFIEKLNERAS